MHSTIQSLLRRRPFCSFEVRMSNGDAHQVRHPEMAFLLKSNVIFGSPDSDEFAFVSLLHVVEVKAIESSSSADDA
ncbi:MAG: hypothetical protein ACRCT8_03325 [Lacipirellulaceae bacterium]